jgi:hypothetical protein
MKRLNDYLQDIKVSLRNEAMEAFVNDAHRGGPEGGRKRLEMISSCIAESTNLDITSMMAALASSKELEAIKLDELSGVVPPWNTTLVEWAVPGEDTTYGHTVRSWLAPEERSVSRMATLNILLTVDELCAMLEQEDMLIYLGGEDDRVRAYSPDERRDILIENHPLFSKTTEECRQSIHWYMLSFPFVRLSTRIIGPIFETHYAIAKDGTIVVVDYPGGGIPPGFNMTDYDPESLETIRDDEEAETAPGHHLVSHKINRRIEASAVWNEWTFVVRDREERGQFDVQKYLNTAHEFAKLFIAPTVTAFHYANYRNIVTREVAPRYSSRQEARAAERRKEPPLTKYHVLEILPAGSTNRARARDFGTVLREMPLHGVRRHTRTYTPERPLFGVHGDPRYYGTFWIPPHTRGKESSGVVQKDYIETDRTFIVAEQDRHGITPA